jgi:hypothetical protein
MASNKDYLLLVRFEGVAKARMMQQHAQRIDEEYMDLYGDVGALTVFILDLEGDFDLAVRYQGPQESVAWLQNAIQDAAVDLGGSAYCVTPEIVGDITDDY